MKAKVVFVLLVGFLFLTAGQAAASSVTVAYPSSSSTVIDSGNNGMGDGDWCCFWSVSRGDSITQSYVTGQAVISSLDLSFGVPFNMF